MWAYAYMKGWKENDHIEFDFNDAHDIKPLTDRASDETIFKSLRERMANARQAIVIVGEYTKNLYKFVRWEIELAQRKDLPIVVVNLNDRRAIDLDRCPSILKQWPAVHVPFKLKIIQFALDSFVSEFGTILASKDTSPRFYNDDVYRRLGID